MRLLRPGCLGTTQYLATAQTDHVSGYADVSRLMESPEALAGDASNSPLIIPLGWMTAWQWYITKRATGWKLQLVSVCESSTGPKTQEEGRKDIRSG